ncbi:MAG: 1-deoxy-D-xylulose-5-phosphate reductoisomerase [Armatimonadota bacterium]
MKTKRIVILGSTGSIGTQTLDIIPHETGEYEIVGLAAGRNGELLLKQAAETEARYLGLADEEAAAKLGDTSGSPSIYAGREGLQELVIDANPDLVIAAISGFAGLPTILTALEQGIDVAIANKEPLVAAGKLVTDTAAAHGASLIPIDSELSAIFQCLQGEKRENILEITLTASGGPFSDYDAAALERVTPEQALEHPNWKMGRKVTIDSATLMNKGFEMFEVRWLFGVSFNQIRVAVHHQSIIHSLVQFHDRSAIAQLGWPDMRVPILYAVSYPDRVPNDLEPFDLVEAGPLTFDEPDRERFPCLRLAEEAGAEGGAYPVVLGGADEAAVDLFLRGQIRFNDIPACIEQAMESWSGSAPETLAEIEELNEWARRYVLGHPPGG